MDKRIKLRKKVWKELHGNCSERAHKTIARIEVLYNKCHCEMVYVVFTDDKGNLQRGALTVLNFKDLHYQPATQNRLYFHNVATNTIVTMDTRIMPRYMSKAEITAYNSKLKKEEKERIANMEKKNR